MLRQETFQQDEGGWILVRSFSDDNKYIRQDETGILYEEAIDPDFMHRTYTETDIEVIHEPPPEERPEDENEENWEDED